MRVPTFKALRRVLPAAICAALLLCGCGAAKPEAAPAAEKQEAAVPSATPAPTPAPTPEPTPAPTPEPEPEAGTPVEDPALRDWLDYLDGGWVSADQPEPYDWAGWLRGRIEAGTEVAAGPDGDLTVTETFKTTSVSMVFRRVDGDHMRVEGTEGGRWTRASAAAEEKQ